MNPKIENSDAFLMISESSHNADMYYATKFLAHDSFIYLSSKTEKLIVSDMELGRAEKESKIKEVIPTSKYNISEKLKKNKDVDVAICELICELLNSENLKRISVPYNFPVQLADCIRNNGFEIIPIKSPFYDMRQIKTEYEISAIQKAQRAGEKALFEAIKTLKSASIKNGVLWKNDSPLTSEDLKAVIDSSLLLDGCEAPDIIFACGKGSSDPHWQGSGELRVDEPIVIDMVPRTKKERYYSDMSRTVMIGNPENELKEMYEAVFDSQMFAIKKIKSGVTGSEIHNIVCDILEERGYETSRGKSGITEGFIHSTGHGVGLDIHEAPSISENGKEFKKGCVVTVEPGLYYKNIGGVRLEDVVVVTQNGCKNLTMFEKNFVISLK